MAKIAYVYKKIVKRTCRLLMWMLCQHSHTYILHISDLFFFSRPSLRPFFYTFWFTEESLVINYFTVAAKKKRKYSFLRFGCDRKWLTFLSILWDFNADDNDGSIWTNQIWWPSAQIQKQVCWWESWSRRGKLLSHSQKRFFQLELDSNRTIMKASLVLAVRE